MKTVLIVDDSEFMRTLIKTHISELDVTVVGEAEDGKDAVEKYKELSPDIVTLDLAMQPHGGIEALKEIKEHNPEAKVVIVSSTGEQDPVVDKANNLGAYAILNKPISKEHLLFVMNKLLNEMG